MLWSQLLRTKYIMLHKPGMQTQILVYPNYSPWYEAYSWSTHISKTKHAMQPAVTPLHLVHHTLLTNMQTHKILTKDLGTTLHTLGIISIKNDSWISRFIKWITGLED